jgi:hypothetical protein
MAVGGGCAPLGRKGEITRRIPARAAPTIIPVASAQTETLIHPVIGISPTDPYHEGGQESRMTTADWINVVLTFVTTLMAVGTFCLAWYTRNLVKQAERHHQEDLRPFCVIDFKYPTNQDSFGIDWNSNSGLAEAKMRGEESPPPAAQLPFAASCGTKERVWPKMS